jgi:hypothetical protein
VPGNSHPPGPVAINTLADRDLRDVATVFDVQFGARPRCIIATPLWRKGNRMRPGDVMPTSASGRAPHNSSSRKEANPIRIGRTVATTPITTDNIVPVSRAASQVPAQELSRQFR